MGESFLTGIIIFEKCSVFILENIFIAVLIKYKTLLQILNLWVHDLQIIIFTKSRYGIVN